MAHDAQDEEAPVYLLARDAERLGGLLEAADGVGAALGLFGGLRHQLDLLESQAVMEARRRGMDWREIAGHQGLNSSQAASQRHQRLTTRLEEIRQGVR